MKKELIYAQVQGRWIVYATDGALTLRDLISAARKHFGITKKSDYKKLIVGAFPFFIKGKIRVCMCKIPKEKFIDASITKGKKTTFLEVKHIALSDIYFTALSILNGDKGFDRIKLYPGDRFGSLLLISD